MGPNEAPPPFSFPQGGTEGAERYSETLQALQEGLDSVLLRVRQFRYRHLSARPRVLTCVTTHSTLSHTHTHTHTHTHMCVCVCVYVCVCACVPWANAHVAV